MTRRNRVLLLAAGLVVAGALIGFAWITVTGVRWIAGQARTDPDPAPLTDAEKRLLVTAADLARIGGPAVDRRAENWSALRQGTGRRFILYLYEPDAGSRISLYSRLAILPTPAEARRMYGMDKDMMKLGSDGESYVPAPRLFRGGGDASAWFIDKDGETIGNSFLVHEGRFLHSVHLTGLTLDDPADVQNLLGPMLNESKQHAH